MDGYTMPCGYAPPVIYLHDWFYPANEFDLWILDRRDGTIAASDDEI